MKRRHAQVLVSWPLTYLAAAYRSSLMSKPWHDPMAGQKVTWPMLQCSTTAKSRHIFETMSEGGSRRSPWQHLLLSNSSSVRPTTRDRARRSSANAYELTPKTSEATQNMELGPPMAVTWLPRSQSAAGGHSCFNRCTKDAASDALTGFAVGADTKSRPCTSSMRRAATTPVPKAPTYFRKSPVSAHGVVIWKLAPPESQQITPCAGPS
mmetsp:Transcript_70617/g.229413  ORF Transcript_70617/g.229413 Transcript_70617/m.229413 type:complete len:209 (-) Transcript_70617:436-1062(-)